MNITLELIENCDLSYYYNIIKRYTTSLEIIREDKLDTLLQINKSNILNFNLENHIIGTDFIMFNMDNIKFNYDLNINKICGNIENLIIYIYNNTIEKIELNIKIINTTSGKLLQSLISNNIDIKLYKKITNHKVTNFYIE